MITSQLNTAARPTPSEFANRNLPVDSTYATRASNVIVFVLLVLLAAGTMATSFVMPTDQNLLDKSALVVVGTIEAVGAAPGDGTPATDYQVRVEQVLKGFLLATDVVVRVPGGVNEDGMAYKVYGTPRLQVGARTILFLNESDGAFRVSDMELGAFLEGGIGAGRYAYRKVAATEVATSGDPLAAERLRSHLARDFDRFTRWIAEHAAGSTRPADYFLESSREIVGTQQEFASIVFPCQGGDAIGRWRELDRGESIAYRMHSSGQANVPGGGFQQIRNGISAWNSVSNSTAKLNYAGTTGNPAGGTLNTLDFLNRVIPEDLNNVIQGSFQANQGGTLAITALFADCGDIQTFSDQLSIDDAGGDIQPFSGPLWIPIADADIIGQDGLGANFLTLVMDAALAFERIFTHELGHGLGMGHSCGNGVPCTNARGAAIMRPDYIDSLLGSTLGADDKAGIRFLYPAGQSGGNPPAAPTDLTAIASSTAEIELAWDDNATNETGYLAQERALGSTVWSDLGTFPANTTTLTVEGIPERTARVYRVAAFNTSGTVFSNEAQATTHATIGPCTPDQTTLCLNDERFEFTAKFLTPFETGGDGNRVTITEDTGYFTFFNPENVELVVKIVNACVAPFDRFWVFAGGLTDVQVVLTVTDTVTGDTRTYFNPLGTAYAPVQDTQAFDTCDAP